MTTIIGSAVSRPQIVPSASNTAAAPGNHDTSFGATLKSALATASVGTRVATSSMPAAAKEILASLPVRSEEKERIFFPAGFPKELQDKLTRFLSQPGLSSDDKDAMWSSMIIGLDLANNGPPEIRQRFTAEARFDSPSFNPDALIADYAKALAKNGYPNLLQALQSYLLTA